MRRRPGLAACASLPILALSLTLAGPARADDLAPPPPIAPGTPGSPTEGAPSSEQDTSYRLDEAERKDSGRNFELFWLDGSVGASYINMSQFSSESLKLEKTDSFGPAFSLGAGVRFVVLVLGVRARYNALSAFNMWQLNGEAGLKLPISSLDLHFGLHGGYSFVGKLGDAAVATDPNTPDVSDKVQVRGFNAGLDFGLDYYLSPLFSIGVGAMGDFLYLNRPPVDKPAGFAQLPKEQQDAINNDPLYKQSGTTAGLQVGGGLVLGLHLGL